MVRTIAIVATLDTKGREVEYLKAQIAKRGHRPLVIDIGMGAEAQITADITSAEIASAGGASIDELRASTDRRQATEIMINGAKKRVQELYSAGELDGIISLGGASGYYMAAAIMRSLPFGVPKFVVSSAAAVPAFNYIGTADLTLMHSVVEGEGMNQFLKNVLSRAAGAVCGMAEMEAPLPLAQSVKPSVAVTGFGYIEKCTSYVTELLEERGYEPVRFHATGIGEMAMEELIERGFFAGVVDLTPSSISHAIFGGVRVAGPERLEVAGRVGIPQVVTPGGVNTYARMSDQLTPELRARKHYAPDARRFTVRMNAEELISIAPVYADKLNKARGPVKFLVPLRGWSAPDREGGPLYEPETDRVFIEEMRKRLKPEIEIREIDANIEDPVFAEAVVAAFEEIMPSHSA